MKRINDTGTWRHGDTEERKNPRVSPSPRLRVAALCLMLAACKSPFDRTRDASRSGALGTFSTTGSLTVYSNELKTGGGAFIYPGGENQALSFSDTSNPVSARSIRYTWNGGDVSAPGCPSDPQHVFAGFDLMHTPTQSTYDATPGRDLRQTNYTRVTFFARGTLTADTVIKVEAASSGTPPGCVPPTPAPCVTLSTSGTEDDQSTPCGSLDTLTTSWQPYTLVVANSDLAAIKDFFKATFVYNGGGSLPGAGGTVYFDQIQYAP